MKEPYLYSRLYGARSLWLIPVIFSMLLLGAGESDMSSEDVTDDSQLSDGAEVESSLSEAAPGETQPASAVNIMPSGANVAVIPIEGMIYDFVLESLKRRVDRAVDEGATVIVIELDTPGGVVTSALEISKYIKSEIPVYTIAWINNDAYSAGIMIASSCDEIIMSDSAATGDCAPIVPGQELAPTERAKALSPILEEFRDNATDNGYDYVLFHAMCELEVEVYYVEHNQTGERRLVNQVDYALMVEGRDIEKGGVLGGLFGGSNTSSAVPAHVTRESATDEDIGKWKPVEKLSSGARLPDGRVHNGQTLLTLNQTRAHDIGLSRETVRNLGELKQYLSAGSVSRVSQTWSEDLAGYLTNPLVRGVLIIALLLGAYMEFQSPGLGVPGLVAAIALILLLVSPFLIGLAEVWHIIMFAVGFVLLIIELVFTPSFGLLGIVGLCLMFAGLVLSVVPTGGGSGIGPIRLPPPEMWHRLISSLIFMVAGLFASMIGFYYITKHFGRLPFLNRLMLGDEQPVLAGVGGTLDQPLEAMSGDEAIGGGVIEVGQLGRVSGTGLRPSGRVDFGGRLIDVVSIGAFIEPGGKVKVVEVHGNRIVVDAAGQ